MPWRTTSFSWLYCTTPWVKVCSTNPRITLEMREFCLFGFSQSTKMGVLWAKSAIFIGLSQFLQIFPFFLFCVCFLKELRAHVLYMYGKLECLFSFFLLEKTCEFLLFHGKIYPLYWGQNCHEHSCKNKEF